MDVVCIENKQCDDIHNLTCINGACSCSEHYFWTGVNCGKTKYMLSLRVLSVYFYTTEHKVYYGSSCAENNQCESDFGLKCISGFCRCEPTHFWDNRRCGMRVID